MNYTVIKKLPPIEEMINAYPLSAESVEKITQDRQEIKNI
jgi:3-deoxy-7-phosphoheptulonate synthase